jgi:hypothetical protein
MAERWSYHLENRPSYVTGDNEGYFKSIYDNQGIDPNAELQRRAGAYRQQYGAAAGSDDATTFKFMASGQAPPAPKNAPTAQQWNSQPAQNQQRSDELFKLLMQRANQGAAVSRTDPNIRAQVDPVVAQQERANRNYLDDVAEKSGPLANLQGERRLMAERGGQQAGAFESEVIGREIGARREEIQQALQLWGSMLSGDQRIALEKELAVLNDNARNADRIQGNDQFMRELALREWVEANQDDYRRSGI